MAKKRDRAQAARLLALILQYRKRLARGYGKR